MRRQVFISSPSILSIWFPSSTRILRYLCFSVFSITLISFTAKLAYSRLAEGLCVRERGLLEVKQPSDPIE